jgi:hypothetical protein
VLVSISGDLELTARPLVTRSIETSYRYMPTRRDRFSCWHEHRRHAARGAHVPDLLETFSAAQRKHATDRSTSRALDQLRGISITFA